MRTALTTACLLLLGSAALALPAGCAPASDETSTGPAPTVTSPAEPGGLSPAQRRRADQLVSIFENGTLEIQYGYAENLDDGRGVTAGRAGFTTGDGDALDVIRAYTGKHPGNPLARFIPALERSADKGEDAGALPEDEYIAARKQAAHDADFRSVQDAQVDARYFAPAQRLADQLGLSSALARTELYDASVQHGNGSGPDALPALASRTSDRVGSPARAGERAWLDAFFAARLDDLRHPSDKAPQQEWAASADRVECLRRIAATGNDELKGPLTVTAFGTTYTLQ
ncbi:chitosanase [Streptomyces roseifaciens]